MSFESDLKIPTTMSWFDSDFTQNSKLRTQNDSADYDASDLIIVRIAWRTSSKFRRFTVNKFPFF
jgi:hypothetical protein